MSGDHEEFDSPIWNRFDEGEPPPHLTVLAFADGEYFFCRVLSDSLVFTSETGDVETFDRAEGNYEILGNIIEYWAYLPEIQE